MGKSRPTTVALVCHPATPGPTARSLTVTVERVATTTLSLRFCLVADLAQVVIPSTRPPERMDGLWQATCCEAFVSAGEGPGYVEVNLAPSTAWALYRFTGTREGMTSPPVARLPVIAVDRFADRLELAAVVDLSGLIAAGPWRLALAAVVATADGSRSYWALAHPGARPDFHHRAAFTLALG